MIKNINISDLEIVQVKKVKEEEILNLLKNADLIINEEDTDENKKNKKIANFIFNINNVILKVNLNKESILDEENIEKLIALRIYGQEIISADIEATIENAKKINLNIDEDIYLSNKEEKTNFKKINWNITKSNVFSIESYVKEAKRIGSGSSDISKEERNNLIVNLYSKIEKELLNNIDYISNFINGGAFYFLSIIIKKNLNQEIRTEILKRAGSTNSHIVMIFGEKSVLSSLTEEEKGLLKEILKDKEIVSKIIGNESFENLIPFIEKELLYSIDILNTIRSYTKTTYFSQPFNPFVKYSNRDERKVLESYSLEKRIEILLGIKENGNNIDDLVFLIEDVREKDINEYFNIIDKMTEKHKSSFIQYVINNNNIKKNENLSDKTIDMIFNEEPNYIGYLNPKYQTIEYLTRATNNVNEINPSILPKKIMKEITDVNMIKKMIYSGSLYTVYSIFGSKVFNNKEILEKTIRLKESGFLANYKGIIKKIEKNPELIDLCANFEGSLAYLSKEVKESESFVLKFLANYKNRNIKPKIITKDFIQKAIEVTNGAYIKHVEKYLEDPEILKTVFKLIDSINDIEKTDIINLLPVNIKAFINDFDINKNYLEAIEDVLLFNEIEQKNKSKSYTKETKIKI